jgi:hypothetical protein
VVARFEDGLDWRCSLQWPVEITGLALATRDQLRLAILDALGSLRALQTSHDDGAVLANPPVLVFTCALSARQVSADVLDCTVKLIWPEIWANLSAASRSQILNAATVVLTQGFGDPT